MERSNDDVPHHGPSSVHVVPGVTRPDDHAPLTSATVDAAADFDLDGAAPLPRDDSGAIARAAGLGSGGPLTDSLAWATWALFVGLGLMLSGGGLFATVVGIRSESEGFPTLAIGLVTAAYYLGFLVGSRVALAALASVGHIRVYAALASLLSASILLAGMVVTPYSWVALRFIAGACLAGQYVVAESWLNHLVTNANRGRILSLYSLVTIVAYGVGQVSVGVIDPDTLAAFGIAAIVISVAVAPVALSEDAAPPIVSEPGRMSLRELFSVVPTGVVTSTLVGVAHGAFLGLAAVYATRGGLSRAEVGVFVSMPTVGCLLMQIPISAASDDIDRRAVGALAAMTAAAGGFVLALVSVGGWMSFGAMILIGGTTYPLYSIAGAYTNDWIPTEQLTAAASQLVVLYGAGAFIGPFLASIAMGTIGNSGFAWTIVGVHLAIGVFLVVRIFQWRAPIRAKPWNEVALAGRVFAVPATAVGMGRRIR
ncbi:MAG: MFS transporter, partial [Ilumatobacteraceae bacterium]